MLLPESLTSTAADSLELQVQLWCISARAGMLCTQRRGGSVRLRPARRLVGGAASTQQFSDEPAVNICYAAAAVGRRRRRRAAAAAVPPCRRACAPRLTADSCCTTADGWKRRCHCSCELLCLHSPQTDSPQRAAASLQPANPQPAGCQPASPAALRSCHHLQKPKDMHAGLPEPRSR